MARIIGCLALLMSGLVPASNGAAEPAEESWNAWREQRLQELTAPVSWTSLVGLHWLDEGDRQRIGSAADNEIEVASLPGHFGHAEQVDAGWAIVLGPGIQAQVDGQAVEGRVEMLGNVAAGQSQRAATRLRHGPVNMVVIERGNRAALRVWDETAPARTGFAGLEYFPWQPQWRLRARWLPHEPERRIEIVDVTGLAQPMRNPGAVEFRHDGRTWRLEALQDEPGEPLFLIFGDRSNGRTTYGAGRYLYADAPSVDHGVVLDFNRAFNPPCAFTGFATCPLPPPENRLDQSIDAGERRYRPSGHQPGRIGHDL